MATYDDVVALTAEWPGVTAGSWYSTPGVHVKGKGFCRMWGDREHDRNDVHDTAVLVVMADIDEKQALIDASGGVLFSTPHYDGHGSLLVRLDDVDLDELRDLLEDSYRHKAPKKLIAELDGQQ